MHESTILSDDLPELTATKDLHCTNDSKTDQSAECSQTVSQIATEQPKDSATQAHGRSNLATLVFLRSNDQIAEKRDALIDGLQKRMSRKTKCTSLFKIQWECGLATEVAEAKICRIN